MSIIKRNCLFENRSLLLSKNCSIWNSEYGVRDFSQVKGDGSIDADITRKALRALRVDNLGLEHLDREILRNIIERFNGGPVGIDTIAATIGEERVTIEDLYEPYLIQSGLLHRTPKGRVVSELSYKHLGIKSEREDEQQLTMENAED